MTRNSLTVLAVLLGLWSIPAVAQTFTFTAINDPLGTGGRMLYGIDGSNMALPVFGANVAKRPLESRL